MTQTTLDRVLLGVTLDRAAGRSLHAQLSAHLRRLILAGTVAPGTRLPSSRALADSLSLSRATVVTALDQIISEGYAEGRRGAGVFVVTDLPDTALRVIGRADTPASLGTSANLCSSPAPSVPPSPRPFQTVGPALDLFPHQAWARLLQRAWQAPVPALLGATADPLGFAPLRAAIAAHLRDWRGLTCGPDQVVVTAGFSDAIGLLAQAALGPGCAVVVEDPGHAPLWQALRAHGLRPRAAPVDTQGLDVSTALSHVVDAAAVVVTPSRHFPLGGTLPVSRRLALLDWARRHGGLIIEDDYDSEYRYAGAPLPALAGLETGPEAPPGGGCVCYVGSFSKVMMPALRLGFLVVPPRLVAAVVTARRAGGTAVGLVAQPALARFIESGAFAAHIRRMRRIYRRRQRALLAALDRHMADHLRVDLPPAGMHVVADLALGLARRMSDREVARRAATAGVSAAPLSGYAAPAAMRVIPGPVRQGVVLGYAAFDEESLETAALRLARALDLA